MTKPESRDVLVLGASGMLGHAMFSVLQADDRYAVRAVVRSAAAAALLAARDNQFGVTSGFDAFRPETLVPVLKGLHKPTIINCVGLVKQLAEGTSVPHAVPVNTLLPHRLVELADAHGGRVVHFSTDCVFSGADGNYREDDIADARDVYGLSKYLGEVSGPSAVTIRTSIIGHGLEPNGSLVDWFLAQKGPVRGYRQAIFSGLPTVELARLVRDHVLPRPDLSGLYHVSADPIDKFSLLQLLSEIYGLDSSIEPFDDFVIDRSLDSSRFRKATGWQPKPWPQLVASMHRDYLERQYRHA